MSRGKPISFNHVDKIIEIGYNIGYFRRHAGMTQEQLAEKAGISRVHLSAIEAPNIVQSFSIETLFNIADALGIEAYKLLVFREFPDQ